MTASNDNQVQPIGNSIGPRPSARFASVTRSNSDAGIVEFQLEDLFHCLRRIFRRSVLLAVPLALIASTTVWLLQKPEYRATAILRLSASGNQLVFDKVEERSDFELFKGTQIELVGSRFVMAAALRNPNVSDSEIVRKQQRPVEWLMKNIVVSSPANTEIMLISAETSNPKEAVYLVNAVVGAYQKEVVNLEQAVRQNRLSEIDLAFIEKDAEIRRKRNELKRLAETLGTSDNDALSVQQEYLTQEVGDLRRQLIGVSTKLWAAEAEVRLKQLEANTLRQMAESNEIPIASSDVENALFKDTIHAELLKDKLNIVRLVTEAKASFKSGKESGYSKLENSVDSALSARANEVRSELQQAAPHRIRELLDENSRVLTRLNAEIEVYKDLEQRIAKQVENMRNEVGKVGNKSIDVEMMRSEIGQLSSVLSSIAQEREQLKVELKSRPRVQTIQEATDSEPSNTRTRIALTGLVAVTSFLIPTVLLAAHDLRNRKVDSSRSISRMGGMEILGSVPLLPARAVRGNQEASGKRSSHWQSLRTEYFKRIAIKMILHKRHKESEIVLVTSAGPQDGKSSLASQVAICLARSNKSVILVDFNLRNPVQHRVFGIENSKGVCEVLRSENELDSVLVQTRVANLRLLPAGTCCPGVLQSLGHECLPMLFKELRSSDDYVIIDGCALLPLADMGYVCTLVDGVVLSVRRDASRIRDVVASRRFLQSMRCSLFGVVVIEPSPQ